MGVASVHVLQNRFPLSFSLSHSTLSPLFLSFFFGGGGGAFDETIL